MGWGIVSVSSRWTKNEYAGIRFEKIAPGQPCFDNFQSVFASICDFALSCHRFPSFLPNPGIKVGPILSFPKILRARHAERAQHLLARYPVPQKPSSRAGTSTVANGH
jgi:hypothetical protein